MSTDNELNYFTILKDLKERIRRSRQQAITVVNTHLLQVYWEIGNVILQQRKEGGWGSKVIERLAADLQKEFPDFKGISTRNLKYMKVFAEAWPDFLIGQALLAQLQSNESQEIENIRDIINQIPWAHHVILLSKTKTRDERIFYIKKAIENSWSSRMLAIQIDSQLHLRQGTAITNFEVTLPAPQSDLAKESLKNPYIFDFIGMGEPMHEKDLQSALIRHIQQFMLELGRGFTYVGQQYKLNVEDTDYVIDLLFFNYHLNCFVIFEIKVGEFKPEYTGKLNFYINVVDDLVKLPQHSATIGVLLCKSRKDTVVKYALNGMNNPMGIAEYDLMKSMPAALKGQLPTIEELEQEMERTTNEFHEKQHTAKSGLEAVKDKLRSI